nr:hypothetical protein Iba_chr14dCG0130 [Ipomoea batatas]GME14900.1 hypothetical protein Iba_scaffold15552CG0030 [Ipomoea batatas]
MSAKLFKNSLSFFQTSIDKITLVLDNRHRRKQKKRKVVILFSDLSTCISCRLSLGLLFPRAWYELGYAAYKLSEFPNTRAYTISPSIPTSGALTAKAALFPRLNEALSACVVASGAPLKRKACLRVETRAVSCHCHKVALRMCLIARPCKRGTAEARLSRSAPETTRRCKANSRDGRTE